MKMPFFQQIGVSDNLGDIRATLPVWCSGCNKYIEHDAPHDEGCSVEMVTIAHKARARSRGDLSFKGYVMLYAILICLLAAGYLVLKIALT